MNVNSKTIALAVLSFLGCGSAAAQKGYIIKDNAYSEAAFINKRTYDNNRGIEYFPNEQAAAQRFRPGDISEFGLRNGDVYVSRTVSVNDTVRPYFLLRRADGKTKLYEVKTKTGPVYFYENEQGLKTLNKSNLQAELTAVLSGCGNFSPVIREARYHGSDLTPIFNAYNRCDNSYLSRFRWGILAGFSRTHFILRNAELFSSDLHFHGTDPVLGAFIENPLFRTRHWLINVQGLFQRESYQKDKYVIKAAAVNVPVLLKYRTVGNTIRGFVNAGPALGYSLKRENYIDGPAPAQLFSVTAFQASAIVGGGLEFSVAARNSLSFELRGTNGFGLAATPNKHLFTAVQLLAGYSF